MSLLNKHETTEFEKKKREKLGLKKGEPAESDMLEWIDLQKQLQVDRDTGKSYVTTPWEKTKGFRRIRVNKYLRKSFILVPINIRSSPSSMGQ